MDSKKWWPRILGIYLTIWIIIMVWLLLRLWPNQSSAIQQAGEPNSYTAQSSVSDSNANDNQRVSSTQNLNSEASLIEQCPVASLRFVQLVLIIGALGACLHGITSLAYHCSENNFSKVWNFWYFCRPFAGGILALIFYLIIKGGFMSPGNGNENMFYVILGTSGMIGLFSNQALDRLSVIFDAMFASLKDKNAKFYGKNQTLHDKQDKIVTDETLTTETPPKKKE